jgi:hypothetical protein
MTRLACIVDNQAAALELNKANARSFRERLTIKAINEIYAAAGNRCAICGAPPDGKRNLALDHDHATDTVRGVLCMSCNVGLGHFNDDVERMRKAIAYLELHRIL